MCSRSGVNTEGTTAPGIELKVSEERDYWRLAHNIRHDILTANGDRYTREGSE